LSRPISRILWAAIIHLGKPLLAASSGYLHTSGEQPSNVCQAQSTGAGCALLALLRVGFTQPR